EALQYGSRQISPEHILLGLMRGDKTISARFFPFRANLTVEAVRREVEERIVLRERMPQSAELHLAPETKRVLVFAKEESERLQTRGIDTEHLLLGMIREENSIASEILDGHGLHLQAVREDAARIAGYPKFFALEQLKKETPHLSEFTRDLTNDAATGKLDPLVGREKEVERIIEILCRRTKNNPVLIGESGVGKTAIVEGLAQRIVDGNVPTFLENKRILSLDLSLVVAGTKYRGQFEERLKQIMKELAEHKQYIVFIDELHTLVGAGSAEGSLDAANILKPALSRGEIQCIGATTPHEFRRSIEKDRALERRFQPVKIAPPNEEDALKIVEGIAERYEAFHQIRYSKDALHAAVYQTNRYIPDRFLPDKAIDVLDEAGAKAKLRFQSEAEPSWRETVNNWKRSATDEEKVFNLEFGDFKDSFFAVEVTKADVEEVVARWTGIPVAQVKQEEAQKLLQIEAELHRRIVSQRAAISALARAIRRSRAGLKNPNKPVGSFLFLGATGVGKTEVARSLAEFLFGSERALVRFDMSEFMEKHAVAKFIGSPPGYVGHEEGGQLTEKLRRAPYSVVLFDEIEKAHPDLFNILLQVFEDGVLTDAQGNAVDCKNAIFIMTSNIGARLIQKRGALGFQANSEISREKTEEQILAEVRKTFAPEFINRLDEIIIFDELTSADLLQIIDLQVQKLNDILEPRALQICLTDEAKKWLIEKTCADRNYGARPLKRALQKYVEDELSEALIQGELTGENLVEVYCGDGKLKYRPVALVKSEDALLIK
ncbi:MAG: ATP-dependent Clp protease ATP-binding subunit, partial [Pyrinomonadaceae bacterium]